MSGSLRAILRPQRWTLRSGPQGPAGDTGGAGVTSVNGDEGPDVTLDAADVGADPAGTAAGLVAALGNSSTRDVGTTAGTVAAGDDSRITGAVQSTRSISTTAPLAGGGTLAGDLTLTVGAASTSAAGVVELATSAETAAGLAVQASDTRLSDSRAPSGTASGDLSGTYPGPAVAKVAGVTPGAGGLAVLDDASVAAVLNTIGGVPAGQWAATGITDAGATVTESISLASWQAGGAPRPLVGADVRQVPVWTTSGTPRWVSRALTVADVGGVVASTDVSDTPGNSLIPRADGSGIIAAGWLPAATTSDRGTVELATDLEATSSVVPTGADTRLGWAFRSLHLATGY